MNENLVCLMQCGVCEDITEHVYLNEQWVCIEHPNNEEVLQDKNERRYE